MCGICGWLGPGAEPDAASGRAMTDLLAHRGPDGAGELPLPSGWMGQRRLKVVDLTEAGDQPMTNEDGSIGLVYNGEIYNFRELRTELAARGHRFRSTGDTEVVLRAYEEWGEDCCRRLDGMFAFAVWDSRSASLFLARDRTGKKPLYYSLAGNRLTFASEIKSLLRAPWIPRAPDLDRIPEFLVFGYPPGPRTMYRGISQLPPGSSITYGSEGLTGPHRFWNALPEDQTARLDRTF